MISKSNLDISISNNNYISYAIGLGTGLVTGVAAASFFPLCSVWNWAANCFTENANRRDLLNRIEQRLADPAQSLVAKLYFRELKEKITATEKMQDPAPMCLEFEETSRRYRALVLRVETAVFRNPKEEALSLSAAELLYTEVFDELERLKALPITETEKSIYIGRITQAFRELYNDFARDNGRPLHRFCGCHILEDGQKRGRDEFTVPYPSEFSRRADLDGRSALLQSWSLGGGHNVAQRGMSQRLAEAGMHAYHVEADKETLLPFDMLRGFTGERISDTDLIRFLMKNNCWKTLRLMNWAFSGKPSPKKYRLTMDQFMRSILIRGTPELQMTIYARNAGAAANGAGELGVADINISTDLLSDFFDIENSDDMGNPHFANAAMVSGMVSGKDINDQSIAAVGPERTVVTGFPVRKAFLQIYDIDALRQERGVDSDARVVILSSGGEGIENGYAEYIVNYYETHPNLPKIHLVVLCGRNAAKEVKLKEQFAGLNNPRISVEVIGWTNEDELAQLNAIAADPKTRGALISTKGGGGTLSEGLASGVPMLLGSSDDIEWEKVNIDYVCEHSCGLRFKGEPDVMEKLFELFELPYHRIEIDSKGESMRLTRDQIQAAEADAPFQALRKDVLKFDSPAFSEI